MWDGLGWGASLGDQEVTLAKIPGKHRFQGLERQQRLLFNSWDSSKR